MDARGRGALSSIPLPGAQKAKLDERLDRIEEIARLTFDSIKGYIHPFSGPLKKIKIRGNVALRPILVLGPFDREREITFLLVAEERDNGLIPADAADIAHRRLREVLQDRSRRRLYERD